MKHTKVKTLKRTSLRCIFSLEKNVINLDLSNPSVLLRKELFGNYTTFIWKINEGQKNYNCYCATGISVISYPLRSLTKANQKDIKKRSVSTLKGDTHNVSTTPLWQGGFRQCLPFSWTTLRGKHCQHPIAVMGVVDTFGFFYFHLHT